MADSIRKRLTGNLNIIICVLLVLAVVVIYGRTINFDFITVDDAMYVSQNPYVQAGLRPITVWAAFTRTGAGNWHPLTWLSFMLDTDLAKLLDTVGIEVGNCSSGIYHFTNLILHAVNSVLLFIAFHIMTGARWRSAFVAFLFAIHPLHVESVAWISERKDVLSTLFWMLVMLAYVQYAEGRTKQSMRPTTLFLALGLMAKPMLVSLPLVLIMLDWWPLRRNIRFKTSVMEKLPLLFLAGVSSIVTIWAQQKWGAVQSFEDCPFGARVANALVAYVSYLKMMVWPKNLAMLYPHPGTTLPVLAVVASTVVLVATAFLVVRFAKTKPYLAVGLFWYVVTLIPVIGLVQVGAQAMADRYTYIPLIGIFLIIAWAVPDITEAIAKSKAYAGRIIQLFSVVFGIAVLLVLALVAYTQVGYWKDDLAAFGRAIAVTKHNAIAHNNLGSALLIRGELKMAESHFRQAIRIKPGYINARYNLALSLDQQGLHKEAIEELRRLLLICPDNPQAHNYLGSVLIKQGNIDEAILHFKKALKLYPRYDEARRNLEEAQALKQGE